MVENKVTADPTVMFSIKWKIIGVLCMGLIVLTLLLLRFTVVGYEKQFQKQQEVTAGLIKELNLYVLKMEGISQYIAGNKYVIERLQESPAVSRSEELNRDVFTALYSIKQVSQASIVYLMNHEGTVIAGTTYDNNQTLTGQNYRFRPYFKRAMEKQNVIYPALGVTTRKRGLYFSSPVMAYGNGTPIGVVVIKMGMEHIDQVLANFPYIAGIKSSEGIIFACNRQDWMYQAAMPLATLHLQKIAPESTIR